MSKKKLKSRFPRGWNNRRVQGVIRHYDEQSDAEAIAEDELRINDKSSTTMRIPKDLVPKVRAMIARREQAKRSA